MVETILCALRNNGFSASQIVACSLNPNDKGGCVYYCYSGAKLQYVVTASMSSSRSTTTFQQTDEIVRGLKRRIADAVICDNMLHPFCCLEVNGQAFPVSRYTRPILRFNIGHPGFSDYQLLLTTSSEWILRFQQETLAGPSGFDPFATFKARFCAWSEEHGNLLPRQFQQFSNVFLEAWKPLTGSLPNAARHGDYCFVNYFCDRDNRLCVFDWEFVAEQDTVACDFFCNIVAYAIYFRRHSQILANYGDLFGVAGSRNRYTRSLQDSVSLFEKTYSVSTFESRVLFVYAYLYLMMRCQADHLILERASDIRELAGILAKQGSK